MTEPDNGTIRPEGATSTPRAEKEATQILGEQSNTGATPSDIRKTQEQPKKIETSNWRRVKFPRGVTPLVSILTAVLAGALFSWLFSLNGVTDVEFVDYFGSLAIILTLIGAVVFFYVAVLTVQVNRESRDMRKELDELKETLYDFKNSVEPELERLRKDVDKQHKEVQKLKN